MEHSTQCLYFSYGGIFFSSFPSCVGREICCGPTWMPAMAIVAACLSDSFLGTAAAFTPPGGLHKPIAKSRLTWLGVSEGRGDIVHHQAQLLHCPSVHLHEWFQGQDDAIQFHQDWWTLVAIIYEVTEDRDHICKKTRYLHLQQHIVQEQYKCKYKAIKSCCDWA